MLHVTAASGGYFLTPNNTKMLLHVAAASDGIADVSSQFAAVPHLRPDAMVHGLHSQSS